MCQTGPRPRAYAVVRFLPLLFVASIAANAQDIRTVTEPAYPAVCTVLSAQQGITANEPNSETLLDTSRIQAALTACPSGQAVRLSASGSNIAFLSGPIAIPTNRTLILDGGVTLFASRNPADYQIPSFTTESCGTVGSSGDACYPLITIAQSAPGGTSTTNNTNANTGLMGYGVIDGRGGDKLIVNGVVGTESWWDLGNDARSGGSQNNPNLVYLYKANNTVLYKVTLKNSPHFHVKNQYSSGWTVWGIKIITPWTARNTDGIDPTGTTNVTIRDSVIGDGDDEIAISGSTAAQNFSFSNLLLPSGHGVSIGSYTTQGVSNVVADGLYFYGKNADTNQEALHIKTARDRGNIVKNITYKNVCIQNVTQPIELDPFYNSNSGSSYPTFQNITFANIHVLPYSGTPSVTPRISFVGYDATHLSTVTLDNLVIDNTPTYNAAWTNTTFTFSNAISGTSAPQVYPASLTTQTGTGVTYTNSATISSANAYDCTGKYPLLSGELFATNGTSTPSTSLTVTNPASITLNVMVQPVNTQTTYQYTYSNKTYTNAASVAAAPTAGVQFLEAGNVVGTASLSANGTLASVTIANPTAGTHTYTASYIGDANYPAQAFGSVTVNVSAGPATKLGFTSAPPSSLTYGTAPGTVSVAVQDVSGSTNTTATPSVTLTITNSASAMVQSLSANAVNGVATFNLASSLPGVGSYTYTASSPTLTAATAAETVTPATLLITANPASRIFGDSGPVFTYTPSGFVNNDNASVISGAPVIASSATRISPAASYSTTVDQGTLSAVNYNFLLVGNALTISGGAAQSILFAPLPNLPSGGTYQLSARSTSGLPITYQVSGPATLSGSAITVTGAGPVTITATQPGDGNYAASTPASRTFTAQ